MTGIRGGGIISGAGSPGAVVPQKIITDEVNKRKSLKGESCEIFRMELNLWVSIISFRDRELNRELGEGRRRSECGG